MVRRYERLTEVEEKSWLVVPGSLCKAPSGPCKNNTCVLTAGLAMQRGLANGLGVCRDI